VVSFASYLTWFWLLRRYLATGLSVFSFMTPLFGVAFGVLVLGEPSTGRVRRLVCVQSGAPDRAKDLTRREFLVHGQDRFLRNVWVRRRSDSIHRPRA
jgi:hypothetical protein